MLDVDVRDGGDETGGDDDVSEVVLDVLVLVLDVLVLLLTERLEDDAPDGLVVIDEDTTPPDDEPNEAAVGETPDLGPHGSNRRISNTPSADRTNGITTTGNTPNATRAGQLRLPWFFSAPDISQRHLLSTGDDTTQEIRTVEDEYADATLPP